MKWKDFFNKPAFRNEIFISVLLLVLTMIFLTHFLNWVENRQGVELPDPVLESFKSINLTWWIFLLIYGSIILAIITFIKDPGIILFAVQAYVVMVLIRIIMMYLVPLNPPEGMITLKDPFVELFGTGRNLTKDLFFSGHTATLFLLFLIAKKKYLKIIFIICTITVAVFLLLQHVHYSIDVIGSFFFSYTAYRLVKIARNKFSVILVG
jgi:membrane-associated phospholipid phosphatase